MLSNRFRCFRIRITGANASQDYDYGSDHYLCCAGIELYGTLV